MSFAEFEPLLSPVDAAALLGCHPKTLIRLARNHEVPGVRIGKHWRFRASMLDTWLITQARVLKSARQSA
jgi:excisionase family DNA binding protein